MKASWQIWLLWMLWGAVATHAQPSLRIALIPLQGDETSAVANKLRELLKANALGLLDPDLTQAALQGAGYQNHPSSLNLHRAEARALGQSLGCDFFILGKTLVTRRLAAGEQFYYEALAGVFFVETRTGQLAHFHFLNEKAKTETAALAHLLRALSGAWPDCQRAMQAARQVYQSEIEAVGRSALPVPEVIRDDELKPDDRLPTFYQRLKPDYTAVADALGITATVELEAVFQADGTVGDVEVTRWAGFGLDESAVATIKKMRFRPAQQNEKALSLRGLVRYNFRRPIPLAERQDETERLKRSLRTLPSPVRMHPPPRPQ